MIDHKKCTGCKNCYLACMQAHRPNSGSIYDLNLTDDINESKNTIKTNATHSLYFPLFCRHCDDPECVLACMSGAMTKNAENNLVLYDSKQCASCFMCVMNCPFGIIKPDDKTKTFVVKCDFCIQDQTGPNCVKNCPTQAIYLEEISPCNK